MKKIEGRVIALGGSDMFKCKVMRKNEVIPGNGKWGILMAWELAWRWEGCWPVLLTREEIFWSFKINIWRIIVLKFFRWFIPFLSESIGAIFTKVKWGLIKFTCNILGRVVFCAIASISWEFRVYWYTVVMHGEYMKCRVCAKGMCVVTGYVWIFYILKNINLNRLGQV